jgi:hypothetical protein
MSIGQFWSDYIWPYWQVALFLPTILIIIGILALVTNLTDKNKPKSGK